MVVLMAPCLTLVGQRCTQHDEHCRLWQAATAFVFPLASLASLLLEVLYTVRA